MKDKITPSATDDAHFFASLIKDWQPKADQSNYKDGYTASDLMIAKGSLSEKNDDGKRTLTFSMTHRMAMAVIEMPKTVYQFTNKTGGKIPDYTVATSADFGENKPYSPASGIYRYIVRSSAQQDAPTLIGSYANGKKEFTITPTGIVENNYKTYKVDGAKPIENNYELKIGDFLMKDGTLLPQNTSLSPEQKANVAAIVFWTPSETNSSGRTTPANLADDKVMKAKFPNCTHGLAVSLKDVGSMVWQESREFVKDFHSGANFSHDYKELFVSVASGYKNPATDNINRILGYQNTQVLLAYNAYCNKFTRPTAATRSWACWPDFRQTACPW